MRAHKMAYIFITYIDVGWKVYFHRMRTCNICFMHTQHHMRQPKPKKKWVKRWKNGKHIDRAKQAKTNEWKKMKE